MTASVQPTPRLRPCTRVYLLLVALTLATWGVGRAQLSGLELALPVLAVAMFKAHLVGDWFMGLRRVRGPWRWVIVVWLLIPGALISWAFALSYRS